MVAAAVGTVAWLMLPPEISSSRALFEAEATPAPADTIAVPEPASPPEVTIADFGQAQAPSAATTESTAPARDKA